MASSPSSQKASTAIPLSEFKYDPKCLEKLEVLTMNPEHSKSSGAKPGFIPLHLNIIRAADNARKFIDWGIVERDRVKKGGVNAKWKGENEYPFYYFLFVMLAFLISAGTQS